MRYLLEIGTEEIPARFLNELEKTLPKQFSKLLDDKKIGYDEVKFNATPRRMAFIVEGIVEETPKEDVRLFGAPKKISFDADGNPTKALESFMKKNSITDASTISVEDGGGQRVYVDVSTGGEKTVDLIPEIVPAFIGTITFKKQMKWGSYDISFARPMRWLISMIDTTEVPVTYAHLTSSNKTYGVRFQGNKQLTLTDANNYEALLLENCVIVNQVDRYNKIKDGLTKISNEYNAEYRPGDDLIRENVYLTEFANVTVHSIDEEFLTLPDKVLTTSIAKHQKYFTMYSKDSDTLLAKYLFIYDLDEKYADNVRSGSEKVIKARLNDAIFFYNEDMKVKLIDKKERLHKVMFQKELGSVFQKVERIEGNFKTLQAQLNYSTEEISDIERTISLCKNDLVTDMVGEKEFTSLQGYIGRCYAKSQGEKDVVAVAVEEHYFPRFSGDDLPASIVGKTVSVCDKIDSIVAMFSIGNQPKGNKDPYSLRRSALGIIRIASEGEFNINITDLITNSAKGLGCEDKIEAIVEFFKGRVKNYFTKEKGFQHDVVEAVLENFMVTPQESLKVMELLKEYKAKPEFETIINSFNRITNIIEKNGVDASVEVNASLFADASETTLFDLYTAKSAEMVELVEKKEFSAIFELFLAYGKPLETLFDSVMVVDKDEAVKNNRLKMLSLVKDSFQKVADFSVIAYEK